MQGARATFQIVSDKKLEGRGGGRGRGGNPKHGLIHRELGLSRLAEALAQKGIPLGEEASLVSSRETFTFLGRAGIGDS